MIATLKRAFRGDADAVADFIMCGLMALGHVAAFAIILLVCSGCGTRPKPQQGGTGTIQLPGGGASMLHAPENPQSTSEQEHETLIEREYAPEPTAPTAAPEPAATGHNPSPDLAAHAPSSIATTRAPEARPPGRLISERIHARATTKLGTAQKDTAREIGERLANMRGVMWVGVLLLIAGPVVGWKMGWFTNGLIAGGVGLLLIILASVLPGNEAWLGLGGLIFIPIVGFVYYRAQHDRNDRSNPFTAAEQNGKP